MIVVTLTAKVPVGPMILTECRMARLQDGDRLHCEPDFANTLSSKYPDNLVKGSYWDRAGSLVGGKWEVEKTEIPSADKSMASQTNKKRAGTRSRG